MANAPISLTNTFLLNLEEHLVDTGGSLDRPREVVDAKVAGLVLRPQPIGSKFRYYTFAVNGRRSRIRIGRFPDVRVEAARRPVMDISGLMPEPLPPTSPL